MAQSKQLKHRIPVKLRHNWKLVALCVAFLAACWGVFGSGTIRPYVTTAQAAEAETVTTNLTGTKDLFDASVAHEVKLTFTDQAYEDMLTEYFKEGEKKYVEADLTIDGTRIPSVGVRLKGNSTLGGLTWKGQSKQRAMPGGGQRPEGMPGGFQPPEGFRPPGNGQPQTGQPQGNGGPPGGGMMRSSLKAEEPENLPWLISFDEFVEGRRYQGHSQVAVRPAAMGSTTMLKEALGISLVGAAGEPTQGSAYSSFTVNDRSSTPRLVVEYLDEGYAENLGDGVLYKSLASGSFTYKGEDQTDYTTDFKQINKVGGKDLQPVIDLVKWVNEASDTEFAKGLADRLDVESFARYLALQNIMVNFDDMAGPGRNYYLWYDTGTKKFKVITWDLNLAFNGDAKSGVNDTIGMGGFGRGRPQQNQQQGQQSQTQQAQPQQQGQPPQGFTPPEGGEQRRAQGGGMRMGGHPLKEKFLKNATFKKLYEEQYRALYAKLLSNGTASGLLDDLVASYKLNEKADTAKVDAEAQTLRTFLQTRTEALRSDKAISGT
ncbi:spore coat protein CotH [Nonomuraea turkmeniaca]|uniref:Spore coat protein CotH n=1 Tax=Nonomuraea turkmeniaca TaxID=103838 RepID=A0A5S4FXT4_9ACTN|nr:CotH kinase family protein [Nonomuraea turkmeniaca]TMR24921.1 spore coat protein CotH [Nonomuraea turkmeniaca]